MIKQFFFSWTIVILWMAIIFASSHLPATASSELSSGITEFLLSTIEKLAPNLGLDIRDLHHIVRKNAHFLAYLVLGLLTANALRKNGELRYGRVLFSLGICIFYAGSDEFHQLFIPGRSGEVKDVYIDSVGASVGIGLILIIIRISRIKKLRLNEGSYSSNSKNK